MHPNHDQFAELDAHNLSPPVGAQWKAWRVSANPIAKSAAQTPAESGVRPSKVAAGERLTVCWREPDSNHRSRCERKSDRGGLLYPGRPYGVELFVALFDAASPLVPGNGVSDNHPMEPQTSVSRYGVAVDAESQIREFEIGSKSVPRHTLLTMQIPGATPCE